MHPSDENDTPIEPRVGGPDDGAGVAALDDLEIEIDLDEDFLQRVRDA